MRAATLSTYPHCRAPSQSTPSFLGSQPIRHPPPSPYQARGRLFLGHPLQRGCCTEAISSNQRRYGRQERLIGTRTGTLGMCAGSKSSQESYSATASYVGTRHAVSVGYKNRVGSKPLYGSLFEPFGNNHLWTMNSCLTYLYRDASNYKFWGTVTIEGHLEMDQLTPYLHEGEYFLPELVEIPSLTPSPMTEDDHNWHQLFSVEYSKIVECSVRASEFVKLFRHGSQIGWPLPTRFLWAL